jgi:hypothetical protein
MSPLITTRLGFLFLFVSLFVPSSLSARSEVPLSPSPETEKHANKLTYINPVVDGDHPDPGKEMEEEEAIDRFLISSLFLSAFLSIYTTISARVPRNVSTCAVISLSVTVCL